MISLRLLNRTAFKMSSPRLLIRNLKNSNFILKRKLKCKLNKNKIARYSADRDTPKANMTGKEKQKSQEYFFKIIYTNTTSLNNKIMELELYLRCNDWPHMVDVAETWFSKLSVSNIGVGVEG